MKTVLFAVISFAAMLMASAPCHAVDENLVRIKGGSFTMGSLSSEIRREKDEASHSVTLGDFHISKYEVTQKEYRDITGADPGNFKGDNLPVENVTWHEAVQYCNARSEKEGLTPAYTIDASGTDPAVVWNKNANGYRLPTEAEWEYVGRAGTITPFNTGGNISSKQANYYGTYPYIAVTINNRTLKKPGFLLSQE